MTKYITYIGKSAEDNALLVTELSAIGYTAQPIVINTVALANISSLAITISGSKDSTMKFCTIASLNLSSLDFTGPSQDHQNITILNREDFLSQAKARYEAIKPVKYCTLTGDDLC